jgi:hypothetical protein
LNVSDVALSTDAPTESASSVLILLVSDVRVEGSLMAAWSVSSIELTSSGATAISNVTERSTCKRRPMSRRLKEKDPLAPRSGSVADTRTLPGSAPIVCAIAEASPSTVACGAAVMAASASVLMLRRVATRTTSFPLSPDESSLAATSVVDAVVGKGVGAESRGATAEVGKGVGLSVGAVVDVADSGAVVFAVDADESRDVTSKDKMVTLILCVATLL